MLHTQRFSVSFEYPVYFGTGIFSVQNRAFLDALARREPERRHRSVFVIEQRVAECFPHLVREIERYVEHHADGLALVARPLVVPGGEACKNDARAPRRLAAWFDELGLDRQSFVVVVGGDGERPGDEPTQQVVELVEGLAGISCLDEVQAVVLERNGQR